jgi:tetratricopeptide (TPR) repeat protein
LPVRIRQSIKAKATSLLAISLLCIGTLCSLSALSENADAAQKEELKPGQETGDKTIDLTPVKSIAYPDEKARLFDYVYLGKFDELNKICDPKIADGTAKAYHYQVSALGWLYPTRALTVKAVRTCMEGLKYYPDDLGLQSTLAVSLARNLQWAQALRQAIRVLDKEPKNVPALTVKAICMHRAGREDPGLLLLKRALATDPGNQELNMLVVFYARLRGKRDDAYVAFDRWNQLNQRSAVGYCWRGEFEYDDSRQEEALKSFGKAIALNPDYVIALYKFGKLQYNKQNWAIACKALQRYERLGGHHETGVVRLCDCLLRTKQYKEAVRLCTMAMEMFKDKTGRQEEALGVPGFTVLRESSLYVESQVKRAIAYFYSGEIQKASADVGAVLKEHPDNVPALDLNQKIAFKTGNYAAAVVSLNKLIDIDRDVPMWYTNRAEALKKLGKLDAAQEDLRTVDSINKTGKLPESSSARNL